MRVSTLRPRNRPARTPLKRDRECGALLLEFVITMTLLVVGVMGFLYASQANFRATRDSATRDLVSQAFSNAMEVLENDTFSSLYTNYNNTSITAPSAIGSTSGSTAVGELLDSSGNAAQVLVNFDVDETSLNAAYGPVLDLDGDGVLTNTDVSGSYTLLPTRLTLVYQTAAGSETRTIYVLLGNDT